MKIYDDLCALAEAVGFIFRRQQGSHKLYKHPGYQEMMNFQPDKKNKSKAKKYQVVQLLNFIDEHSLMG